MMPVEFKDIKEGYEYYIENHLDRSLDGLYKVETIYQDTKSMPSPSQDMGNGIMCTLSVAVFREATLIRVVNVFTNETHIIDNEFEPVYKFYMCDSHDRYVCEKQYATKCIRDLMKDKEVYYETETVGSTCIILDVRYSKARDTINFIFMDVHLTHMGVQVKRLGDIKFPERQEFTDLIVKLFNERDRNTDNADWEFK